MLVVQRIVKLSLTSSFFRSLVTNLKAANHFKKSHIEKEENWKIIENASFYYIGVSFSSDHSSQNNSSNVKERTEFVKVSRQSSTANIGHAEARAENTHSGKLAHISINMCDNQNL